MRYAYAPASTEQRRDIESLATAAAIEGKSRQDGHGRLHEIDELQWKHRNHGRDPIVDISCYYHIHDTCSGWKSLTSPKVGGARASPSLRRTPCPTHCHQPPPSPHTATGKWPTRSPVEHMEPHNNLFYICMYFQILLLFYSQ